MNKDFDAWNQCKKIIESNNHRRRFPKPGQVRWYYVGVNIGSEISKGSPFTRPCIITRNLGNGLVGILPLTTKNQGDMYRIHSVGETSGSRIIPKQYCVVSIKRLKCNYFIHGEDRHSSVSQGEFEALKKQIQKIHI